MAFLCTCWKYNALFCGTLFLCPYLILLKTQKQKKLQVFLKLFFILYYIDFFSIISGASIPNKYKSFARMSLTSLEIAKRDLAISSLSAVIIGDAL